MPAGRPPKYNSSEEMQIATIPTKEDMEKAFNVNMFKNENEMVDFVCKTAESLLKELGDCSRIITIEKEKRPFWNPYRKQLKGSVGIRFDVFIKTEKTEYIFEVKNPHHKCKMREAISQCMEYKIYFPNTNIYIVSCKYHPIADILISSYNLDIGLVYLNKEKIAIMYNTLTQKKGK